MIATFNVADMAEGAARVGALAEAERYFAARATGIVPGRGKEVLAQAGIGNPPRPEDRFDGAE